MDDRGDLRRFLRARLDAFLAGDPPRREKTVRVLEVACGPGIATEELYDSLRARFGDGVRLVALDLDPRAITQAHRRFAADGRPEIVLVRGDLYRLPVGDASLDYLAAFNIIHGINQLAFAREAWRALRPGGQLLVYNRSPELRIPRFSFSLKRDDLAQLTLASDAPGQA